MNRLSKHSRPVSSNRRPRNEANGGPGCEDRTPERRAAFALSRPSRRNPRPVITLSAKSTRRSSELARQPTFDIGRTSCGRTLCLSWSEVRWSVGCCIWRLRVNTSRPLKLVGRWFRSQPRQLRQNSPQQQIPPRQVRPVQVKDQRRSPHLLRLKVVHLPFR